jgi:3-dehydroquinate dehydratase/shikimate dehydrogenase
VICCPIIADTKEQAIKQMLLVGPKADIVEIRLDYISDIKGKDIEDILSKKRLPVIMTCRSKDEGGHFAGTEEKRIPILKECIEKGADYVDIELRAGTEAISGLIKAKAGSKIIVSYHNFDGMLENMDKIYNDIKATGCDIVKIACMANSLDDNLVMLNLIKKAKSEKTDIIGHCMGEKGKISRILNLSYGSYLTFGSLKKGKESAPGQISCKFLRSVYRADKLTQETRIYGLVGNPVSKSRGFIMHNLAFKEQNTDAVYLNFLVDNLKDFMDNFKDMLAGLSITMPHKQEIMDYLDEIDPSAKKIGAVNTVVKKGNKLIGYNTDKGGAIEAIEEKIQLENKNVIMLGAGGVARAIGFGLIEKKAALTILNRTVEKAEKLASELNCDYKPLSDAEKVDWTNVDLLINATSIGMMPKTEETPIDAKYLKGIIVFDSVYNPLITKLIHTAEKQGCQVISGIKMFINQAALQQKLWTGKEPDRKFIEEKVLEYCC